MTEFFIFHRENVRVDTIIEAPKTINSEPSSRLEMFVIGDLILILDSEKIPEIKVGTCLSIKLSFYDQEWTNPYKVSLDKADVQINCKFDKIDKIEFKEQEIHPSFHVLYFSCGVLQTMHKTDDELKEFYHKRMEFNNSLKLEMRWIQ